MQRGLVNKACEWRQHVNVNNVHAYAMFPGRWYAQSRYSTGHRYVYIDQGGEYSKHPPPTQPHGKVPDV